MAVLVVAHTAAGGTLPSFPWLVGTGAAVFAAGTAVMTSRLTIKVAVPTLIALQLLLHECLVLAGPAAAHDSTHAMTQAMTHGTAGWSFEASGLTSWPMLVAHVLGALATAAIWELRSRAAEVIATWTDLGLPALPGPRNPCRAAVRVLRNGGLEAVLVAPRRGPPGAQPAFV